MSKRSHRRKARGHIYYGSYKTGAYINTKNKRKKVKD